MDQDDPHMNTRKLSRHSRAVIWQDFQCFDKDRDGFVTLDEAVQVLNKRFGFPPDKTKRLMEKCDRNGDNKLSYDEFIEFYFRVQERVSQLHNYFHESDRNHDGRVDENEARHIMKQMAFNEEEIQTLMAVSDFTGDGKLHYEEFLRFWKQ